MILILFSSESTVEIYVHVKDPPVYFCPNCRIIFILNWKILDSSLSIHINQIIHHFGILNSEYWIINSDDSIGNTYHLFEYTQENCSVAHTVDKSRINTVWFNKTHFLNFSILKWKCGKSTFLLWALSGSKQNPLILNRDERFWKSFQVVSESERSYTFSLRLLIKS